MSQQKTPDFLSDQLLLRAPNRRCGLTLEPQHAPLSFSDDPDIVQVGVPNSVESPWKSAAGGVGRSKEEAERAAVGEAVERYCATMKELPEIRTPLSPDKRIDAEEWHLFTREQRSDPRFPFGNIYSKDLPFTNVYDVQDNQEWWIPHPLVVLKDDYHTGIPTSSGLAAGPTARKALLRAIQELIERDALMVTWLHSLPARIVEPPAGYTETIRKLHGEVWTFDLTPAYSPFPVIAVAGGIPKRGSWRYSLGIACRESWEDAFQKAYLEWNQGILFAGIYKNYVDTSGINDPYTLSSFEEHAIYYTLHPDQWYTLPMFQNVEQAPSVPTKGKSMHVNEALQAAKTELRAHNMRLYYRDVTTIDAVQIGVRVVRAVSPDLAAIFAHQEWPLIGGLEDALKTRYPWAPEGLAFPNLMPHPLG